MTNADVETYFVMDDAHGPRVDASRRTASSRAPASPPAAGWASRSPCAASSGITRSRRTSSSGSTRSPTSAARTTTTSSSRSTSTGASAGPTTRATTRAPTTRASTSPSPTTPTASARRAAFSPVGTAGYAFLESPGNSTDGRDNDEDGITDERRDSGPGDAHRRGRRHPRRRRRALQPGATSSASTARSTNTAAVRAGRWWTGDENLNWQQFTDLNGDGQYTTASRSTTTSARTASGPQAANYPGRDIGEGDGRPTAGEPNFDALDKDESDQIGLTGFKIFNVHDFELIDDEQDYHVFREALPPQDVVLEGGRNLGMFFASGPFPLRAGQTERFSMALIFADKDFTDPRQIDNSSLARKKQTVQQIYNANYQFARPPDKPTLTARRPATAR